MKIREWFKRNYNTILYTSFIIPIIIVALVSISHVIKWYEITNYHNWAIYLSVGIEIAALSALAALSGKLGRKVWLPFGIVTFIQFIGNVFFAYQFIDIANEVFTSWVELIGPLFNLFGVSPTDLLAHKRIIAVLAGGTLPLISLSFLHMLVSFNEKKEAIVLEEETLEVIPKITPEPTLTKIVELNSKDEKKK